MINRHIYTHIRVMTRVTHKSVNNGRNVDEEQIGKRGRSSDLPTLEILFSNSRPRWSLVVLPGGAECLIT